MNDTLRVINALLVLVELIEKSGVKFEALSSMINKARSENREITSDELGVLREDALKSIEQAREA